MFQRLLPALGLFICILLFSESASAQGCVAIRNLGGCGGASNASLLTKGEWQLGANYRYFRSFRHFRGDTEEAERVENGTQVINLAHSLDLGLSYSISHRFSVSATLPLISYDRSSLYEHYGNSLSSNPEQMRFHTQARGIGDLRISSAFWVFDPEKSTRHNLSVGLGIKLPTGNENVQDEFHKRRSSDGADSIVVKPVDQSIQLGDGGVGISLEVQGFASLSPKTIFYVSGFYLSNPQNTNKTLTRGTLEGANPLIAYHSIADQYVARLGLNYALWPAQNLSASLGARIEGIPSSDLIGKSEGFRRPGYVVAAEPGLFYQHGQVNLALSVPVALYRNRVKSTYDLADPSGDRHGDAAFADYSINLGVTWRFGGNHTMANTPAPATPLWKETGNH